MALLIYPVFAAIAAIFYALVIATGFVLYVGGWIVVFVLTAAAMAVHSAWRPPRPKGARWLGGSTWHRRPEPNGPGDGSVWAVSEGVPQARYSNRR